MSTDATNEPSEAVMEIGRRFYPRRYRRYRDLRSWQEARDWARTLDWRNNPYDRFLLRRELIRHIESSTDSWWHRRVIPGEIAEIVDHLLDTFPDRHERLGVFAGVIGRFPWEYGARHGFVRYSQLTKALSALEPPKA